MKSVIISIGDEILIGQTINTNAAFIGEQLTGLGFEIIRVVTVGDDEQDILDVLKCVSEIANVIHVTGGLGPTHDDITRKCVLEFFGTKLVYNESVMQNVEDIFFKRKIKMAEINKDQAMVPESAVILANKLGTAPGYKLEKNGKIFYFTPGVPFEMKGIYEHYILPELKELIRNRSYFYAQQNILTTGIPEASLFELLGDIKELTGDCKLAFLPSPHGVKLRVSCRGTNEAEVKHKVNIVAEKINSIAKSFIYSNEDHLLEEVIAELLTQKKLSLSTAESCTGGLIANRLTNISGSSNFFERGVVTYSNQSKIELISVAESTLRQYGAVSEETAFEMATGVRKLAGTDIALVTTGIMGPTGGSEDKPVGTVFIGVSDKFGTVVKKFFFGDNRLRNKERTSQAALNFLRKRIIELH